MTKRLDIQGVSEIIGTILMLGMAIALFSTVSVIIISYPFSTPSSQVDIISYIQGSAVIFEHHGGPSLSFETVVGITINGSTELIDVETYIEQDLNLNNQWDIGERVSYTSSALVEAQVEVMVIDAASNNLLMMGTIQDVGSDSQYGSQPSLSTSVETISPYEVTDAPLAMSAFGDSALNSVELYYRYDINNWTVSWNPLRADDFESGFGNYVDGGSDCHRMNTVFAYSNNFAIRLRDNSDTSYTELANGLDLDTSDFTHLKIDFWAYYLSIESGEYLEVYFDDISVWTFYPQDEHEFTFNHHIIWVNESEYTFDNDVKIRFEAEFSSNTDYVYLDLIYINASQISNTDWIAWSDVSNPDTQSPWSWSFNFPNTTGYYEFYSIGRYQTTEEQPPMIADTGCYYNP